MEYVDSQPIAYIKLLYLLSLGFVLFLINFNLIMLPFKQTLQILCSSQKFYAQSYKQGKEDDAGEVILFDCLQIVFFKLRFPGSNFTSTILSLVYL